jgi:hypothetical protein
VPTPLPLAPAASRAPAQEARTPVATPPHVASSGSPGATVGTRTGKVGVEGALLAAQLRVMTQKAAGFERQLKLVQAVNEQLKEQVGCGAEQKTGRSQEWATCELAPQGGLEANIAHHATH